MLLGGFKCRCVRFDAYTVGKYGRAMKLFYMCCDGLSFEFSVFLSNILFDCCFDGGVRLCVPVGRAPLDRCVSDTWGCTVS